MDIQPNLREALGHYPESVLKRLIAQPLNGSSVIQIGSGSSTSTRIEIPSCVQRPDLLEIGYQMSFNGGNAITYLVGDTKYQFFIPANYLPEWQRIEIYNADSTNKLVELTNCHKYSKMTSSLFNNYKERSLSQRVNFKHDIGASVIGRHRNATSTSALSTNITTYLPSQGEIKIAQGTQQNTITTSVRYDGYLNDLKSLTAGALLAPPSQENQQEYLPLGYYVPRANGATDINYQPYTYNFNFRLGDIIHDSFLNNMKHYYHRSNLTIVIYWNPITEIVGQMRIDAASTDGDTLTTTPTKNGALVQTSTAYNLSISNLFVRYYSETNCDLIDKIKNLEYEIAYPYLYQANLTLSGSQIGANLMLGQEGETRIYRVYTALFGQSSATNRFMSDNTSNIGNDLINGQAGHTPYYGKWAGNHELYFNNDLYERLTADYGDWAQSMATFKDGSINSKAELEYLGTVAYHFDSSYENGKKDEYKDNILKGKYTDQQTNINPRFLNVQSDGADNLTLNYNCYIFAVVMRKGIVRKGEFVLV